MQPAVTANLGGSGLIDVGEGGSPIIKSKRAAQEGGADSALFAALMACLAAGAVQGQPSAVASEGKAGGQEAGAAAEVAKQGSVNPVGAVETAQVKEVTRPSPTPGQQAVAAPSTQEKPRVGTSLNKGMDPGEGTSVRDVVMQPIGSEEPLPVAPPERQTANVATIAAAESPQSVRPATSANETAASAPVDRQPPAPVGTEIADLPGFVAHEPPTEAPVRPAATIAAQAADLPGVAASPAQAEAPDVALQTASEAQAVIVAASDLPADARTEPTQALPMLGNVPAPANPARPENQMEKTASAPASPDGAQPPAASPAPPVTKALSVVADAVALPGPVDGSRAAPASDLDPVAQIGPVPTPPRGEGTGAGRSVAAADGAASVTARRDRKAVDDTTSVRPQFPGQGVASVDIDAAASGERITRAVVQATLAQPTEAGQRATGETISTLHVALDPPGLGTVHVRVETAGDVVRATVTVPGSGASGALQHLEPQVRAALAEHGLALEQFQLSQQAGQGSRDPQADRPEFVATRPRAAAAIQRTEQVVPRIQMSARLDVVV